MRETPVTVKKAAEIAAVSVRCIWTWAQKGYLRTERTISGRLRIYPSSLWLRHDELPKVEPKRPLRRRKEPTVTERRQLHRRALDVALKAQQAHLAEARRQTAARISVEATRAIRERRA